MKIADAQQGLQEESVSVAKKAIGVLMQMAAKVSFVNNCTILSSFSLLYYCKNESCSIISFMAAGTGGVRGAIAPQHF